MVDYKKMYYLLFNKITDTIRELQEVQKQAVEMYVSADEWIIKILELPKKEEEKN